MRTFYSWMESGVVDVPAIHLPRKVRCRPRRKRRGGAAGGAPEGRGYAEFCALPAGRNRGPNRNEIRRFCRTNRKRCVYLCTLRWPLQPTHAQKKERHVKRSKNVAKTENPLTHYFAVALSKIKRKPSSVSCEFVSVMVLDALATRTARPPVATTGAV